MDPLYVKTVTAITTNAFTFPILVSKITLQHADGAAVLAASLIEGTTNTTTAHIGLTTNLADGTTFDRYTEADFDPPVLIGDTVANVYIDVTGTGTVRVFYRRT